MTAADQLSAQVARNIRTLRQWHDWTLAEFSERLASIGCALSQPELSRIENHRRVVTIDLLAPFADVLGTKPANLLQSGDAVTAAVADFDDALTRTLLAVTYQTRPTVQTVADATGCAKSTAHGRLDVLRMAGLVTWEPRKAGTLRACVGEVFPVPAEVA